MGKSLAEQRIGEENTASNGMKMKIIAYRSATDIDVKFEDGEIICNKTYRNFKIGYITNPLFSDFGARVGETITANNGMKMKIIAYRSYNDIDVQFENGTIVMHRRYIDFKYGQIGLSPILLNAENKVGEENIANNGMRMKIIAYRSCKEVDVQFENGVIAKNKTYVAFKKGQIGLSGSRVGEVSTANNGMKMKIIEYRSFSDIDVQFEDGITVCHKGYNCFKRGSITHPFLMLERGNNVFYNFDSIRKAYKQDAKVYYFCKDEKGNSYILTPQQMLEKSGIKSLF